MFKSILTAIILVATSLTAQADPNTWKHMGIGYLTQKAVIAHLEVKRPDLSANEIALRGCLAAGGVGIGIEAVQWATNSGVADLLDVGATTIPGCTELLPENVSKVIDVSVVVYAVGTINPWAVPAILYVEYIKEFHPELITPAGEYKDRNGQ